MVKIRDLGENHKVEQMYESLFNNLNDPVLVHDAKDNFLNVNEAATEYLGYTREEWRAMNLRDILTPENATKIEERKQKLEEKQTLVFESTHIGKNGEKIPVETSTTVVPYKEAIIYVSVVRDITRRKKAEERFQHLFHNLGDAVFVVAVGGEDHGEILEVNNTAVEQTGWSKSELLGMDVHDWIVEEPQELSPAEIKQRLEHGEPLSFITKRRRKDGSTYWVEENTVPIEYKDRKATVAVYRDVTKRIQAEKRWKKKKEELQEAREAYRDLINSMNDAVFIHDLQGNFLMVNNTAVERLKYTREELLSMRPQDIDVSKYAEQVRERIQKLKKEETLVFETVHVTKKGERIPVEISSTLITYRGSPVILSVVRDITKRKKKEERLRRYKEIIEEIDDPVMLQDKQGRFRLVNDAVSEYTGVPKKDLIGKKETAFLDEKTAQKITEKKAEVIATETKVDYNMTLSFKNDDETYYFKTTRYPYYNKKGTLVGTIGISREITEIKKIRQKLATLHTWTQTLNRAETMDEIITSTLDAIEKTLGFKYATIDLKKADKLKLQATRGFQSIPENIRTLSLQGKGITVKAVITGKSLLVKNVENNPEYLPVSPSIKTELAVPIVSQSDNQVLGVLNVESEKQNAFDHQDQLLLETLASHVATAIKELQEKQKRVSLQELDELRNQFLAMASHEINTPLTPIKSRLEMLQKEYFGELTDGQQHKIKQTLESVDRLIRLVNDFRRASKLQSAHLKLEKETHQLAHTIKKALKQYKTAFAQEKVTLVKQMEQPLTAVYDQDRMIQVFCNLIENALDYTEDTIWVHGRVRDDHIQVSVRDNGPGIPADEQEKIFKPFYRVENEARTREDRQFGGSGLGLHICKQIIEGHGGTIHVDSQPGEGSTFTVTLPRHTRNNKGNTKPGHR